MQPQTVKIESTNTTSKNILAILFSLIVLNLVILIKWYRQKNVDAMRKRPIRMLEMSYTNGHKKMRALGF